MESNNTSCINCEKTTQGLFCHHCGQKQGINRLTWGNLFSDLQKRLFGFDNNFLRTVKDLTIRPQVVVQSSIDGIRVRYIGAVGYYFLMVTISVLVVSIFDIDFAGLTAQYNQSINPDTTAEDLALVNKVSNLLAEHFRLVAFIMIPFFIVGIWIIFKNKGYNFLETSVLTLYTQAHPIWLFIILGIINKFSDSLSYTGIISLLYFLYPVIAVTFFYKGNKIWNFIKALCSLILGFLLMSLAVWAILEIVVGINPDVLKIYS